MQLDIERYRSDLAAFDLGAEQETELIRHIWNIAQSCVDRAWGDAPEQILLGKGVTNCAARAHDRLDSIDHITMTFNDAANEDAAGKTDP
jgi:hypothetical protein